MLNKAISIMHIVHNFLDLIYNNKKYTFNHSNGFVMNHKENSSLTASWNQ